LYSIAQIPALQFAVQQLNAEILFPLCIRISLLISRRFCFPLGRRNCCLVLMMTLAVLQLPEFSAPVIYLCATTRLIQRQ